MPSFDVVSEVDMHEVSNAVDQANREVGTRFDFKGTGSSFESDGHTITSISQSDFQLRQMLDILQSKLSKRSRLGRGDSTAPHSWTSPEPTILT